MSHAPYVVISREAFQALDLREHKKLERYIWMKHILGKMPIVCYINSVKYKFTYAKMAS